MRISEFSKKTNLTKRSLQYYDEIGLLVPDKLANGYREYNDNQLGIVENIMFLKELDYSLEDIKTLLNRGIDKNYLIEKQIEYLEDQIVHIRRKIDSIRKKRRGDIQMNIDNIKKKYQKEVEDRWGKTNEYKQSIKRTEKYTKEDWDRITIEQETIYNKMAAYDDFKSDEIGKLVNKWQNHISKYYYDCSDTVLVGLAEMYVADDRFRCNLNKTKEGFAEFLNNAIKYHKRA